MLNKGNYYEELSSNEKERLNKVMAYIVDNFQKEISLDKPATLINITKK